MAVQAVAVVKTPVVLVQAVKAITEITHQAKDIMAEMLVLVRVIMLAVVAGVLAHPAKKELLQLVA
jgi:hypothetical protein